MMCVQLEFSGGVIFDGTFDCIDILARGYAGPVANAKDVGVNGLGR